MGGIGICLIVFMFSACTGSVGLTARSYVEDKPRVDQEMEGGNYGYLVGTPVPEDRGNYKSTRRMYVLEITKEVEEEDIDLEFVPSKPLNLPDRKEPQPPEWAKPIVIPPIEQQQVTIEPSEIIFVDYEVKKDDTLQKISKEFYDSYSKWPRIFEENKEVLINPDKLKPGTKLRIPVEK